MKTETCFKCGRTGVLDCTKLFIPFKDGEKDGVPQSISIAIFLANTGNMDVEICRDCAIVYLKTLIGHFEKKETG